jgi:hypothetical protein
MPQDKITDSNGNPYTHADTGTAPSSGEDFLTGQKVTSDLFDWHWYEVIESINQLIGWRNDIDSDDNGKADVAEQAESVSGTAVNGSVSDADNATLVKNNDIDSNGDGIVNRAEEAGRADGVQTRTSDPGSPDDGEVWIRTDL